MAFDQPMLFRRRASVEFLHMLNSLMDEFGWRYGCCFECLIENYMHVRKGFSWPL